MIWVQCNNNVKGKNNSNTHKERSQTYQIETVLRCQKGTLWQNQGCKFPKRGKKLIPALGFLIVHTKSLPITYLPIDIIHNYDSDKPQILENRTAMVNHHSKVTKMQISADHV